MRLTSLFLSSFILALATSACATPQRRTETALLDECKSSLKKEFEVQINESLSDDEKNFKEYKDLKFGKVNDGHSFVEIHKSRTHIDDINFTTPSGGKQHIQSESIEIDLSSLYFRRTESGLLYCILAPFSGLGSSGGFQRYVALIAIGTTRKGATPPVGAIIKNPN